MNYDRVKEICTLIMNYMKQKFTGTLWLLIDFSQGGITRIRTMDKFKDI